MPPLPGDVSAAIVERLALAVLIFRDQRLIYCNAAAETLRLRLRTSYRIELEVLLRDHWRAWRDHRGSRRQGEQPPVALVTAPNGEPFYVHVIPLDDSPDIAVTVRAIASDKDAVRKRYGLSARESQVVELVLHGYRNADIATALDIAPGTAKKHLTRVFDKVGVNTRSQLQTRLA